MDYSKVNMTLSGERIKKYCKEHHITSYDLAAILGYNGRNEVSACWNGKKLLKAKHYKTLSLEWGIREEYLLGIDNYKTINEMIESFSEKRAIANDILYIFLEKNGYKISETDYVYSFANGTIEKKTNKYNHVNYCKVYGIESRYGEKGYITEFRIKNLRDDFFTLLGSSILPLDLVESQVKYNDL